ncbi:MAG: hypothetical protein KBC32_10975 [Candidatus Didemnitutus sp.]|nr:hypothetical protein [Candidatus Didemnitutus sp.]
MQGVSANTRLKALRPVLEQWCAINSQLGREWALVKDAPWWYNERALVSVFAGSIWTYGGAALEEYAEVKRGDQTRNQGRIDLWFQLGQREFLAEAKKCWVDCSDKSRALVSVNEALAKAILDAGDIPPDGRPRLAMVFAVALIPTQFAENYADQITSLQAVAKSPKIKADARAWVFPKTSTPLRSSDGYFMPGIILWVKHVQRTRRFLSQ